MENKVFERRSKAALFYGVTPQTISNWHNKGKIEIKTTETGERMYLVCNKIKNIIDECGELRASKI